VKINERGNICMRDVSVDMRGVNEDLPVVVIENPKGSHLGSYMCIATNSLGESHKIVELEGNASKQQK